MQEFDKWFANITKEYPLYQDKDGYNIGNTPSLKAGWKAALKWIQVLGAQGYVKGKIYNELEEE